MLYDFPRTISCKGGGSESYIEVATAKAKIWRGPYAVLFAVSPLAIGSNAEQQLLKLEHLGENIFRELSESLGGGVWGSGVAFGGVAAAADGVACDIQISKNNV